MLCRFLKKAKKKREKKIASAKNFRFKTTDEKSERLFLSNNNNKKIALRFFRIFHRSSLARKKERKMHFQVVNCPSQVCTLRILLLTHREREIFLSFSLCLFFRSSFVFVFCVLLLSSRLVFAFVFVRELNRENGIGNGAAHALAHSLSETTNR